MTYRFTAADGPGIINARCSLADAPCPYCRAARLTFDAATRTNTCPGCGGEVVTEWEWNARGRRGAVELDKLREIYNSGGPG